MVNVMENFGNPFEEDSQYLLVLNSTKIAPPWAVEALRQRTPGGENETCRCLLQKQAENIRLACIESSKKEQAADEIPQEWRRPLLEPGWEYRGILPTWKQMELEN